ncbi:murein L,D-transpeptidase YcbB/YkuD [Algoriphagus sp. 4150]|uniref:L,D-transpeptidase family protein n=1 Tax=Algoriphagus sp. 4150 TaxID=2817756 RepID=UPI002856D6D4|nr:L,D-transpeptidase family protein [Algoriphagus sp. 4150]MDR7130869.1 murein L,D-transpeptidase YcbB/YkuD [Algoriphagus sp. 4150]
MNKKIIIPIAVVLVIALGLIWFFNQRRSDLTDELRRNLEGETSGVLANSDHIKEIRQFYAGRDYLETWLFNDALSNSGKQLLAQIEDSKYDGLQPGDYNLSRIYKLSSNPEKEDKKFRNLSSDQKVTLELLLTDSFFMLAHDLEKGKVNPSTLDSSWKFEEKETDVDYASLLEEVANGASVGKTFANLYPSSELYAQGRDAIRELYEILENDTLTWDLESVEGAIEVGEKHAAIPALRKRLIFWGFLKTYEPEDPNLFDSTMIEGLRKYQEANGMNPDGVIGSLVAESLNKSPQNLIDIASVNMERLRWMPKIDWDQEMVLVNIANYQLDYMDKSDTVFSAKVIVGKEYNESPTFTAPMSYIVFSPYWNIPPSITTSEIIPAIRKNKGYLAEKNMEVVTNAGEPVNAKNVDWSKNGDDFPYRVRQKPGGDNSLGLVKFMFPNEYNIYIHDTPARGLFDRESRALSHGCIRIQNPDQFAKILLNDKSWDEEKIQEAMHQDKEKVVELDRKIPVVLIYMTFWADKSGKANFRSDVYERDQALLEALRTTKSSLDQT